MVRCNCDVPAERYLKLENLQPMRVHSRFAERFECDGADSARATGSGSADGLSGEYGAGRSILRATFGDSGYDHCAPDTAPATKTRAVERMGGRVIKVPFAEWWQTFETRFLSGNRCHVYPRLRRSFRDGGQRNHCVGASGRFARSGRGRDSVWRRRIVVRHCSGVARTRAAGKNLCRRN